MKSFIIAITAIFLGGAPMLAEAHSVGVKVLDLDNGQRIIVWYPGIWQGQEPFSHFGRARNLNAYLDAQPDLSAAPYPLIVRSHGLAMGALDAVNWSVKVAHEGYVVVAFDHSDALACKLDGSSDLNWIEVSKALIQYHDDFDLAVQNAFSQSLPYLDNPVYRTQEFSAVLDGVLAHEFFLGLIDPDKIGAAGHSYGGATVLALGHQAELDCTDPGSYAPGVCATAKTGLSSDFLPSQCCRPAYQGKKISFYDPRVKAHLAVGPGTFLFWPLEVNNPVMLISGDHFEVNQQNMTKPFEAFPRIYWLVVNNTDHMNWASWIYNNIPGAPLLLTGYQIYCLKQAIYREYSLAFFRAHLKGDFSDLERLKSSTCHRISFQYKP